MVLSRGSDELIECLIVVGYVPRRKLIAPPEEARALY